MEPYAKRQRIYSSPRREIPLTLPNQHRYYHERDQPEAYDEPEDVEPIFDPDVELQQRRAQLHGRLKGTFEAIFKKYGRDFEGIADEIDLETGEIVVNNGHLLDMANERDAGLRKLHSERVEVDSEDSITSTDEDQSLDEEEDSADEDESREEAEDDGEDDEADDVNEEEDDEESDSGSDSEVDMDDDDRLLRGFAQANRFRKVSPELGVSREIFQSSEVSREPRAQEHRRSDSRPSPLDIMSQFGPSLGSQIISYISHQEKVSNESHIEPAWRVPGIPAEAFEHNRRPVPVYVASRSEVQRSPSPEASTSIWAAVPNRHGRRTKYRRSSEQVRNGDHRPARRVRTRFTEEDDEFMLDWVVKERQRGTLLWSNILWKSLAAKHPHHTWQSWKIRYRYHFKHVWSNVDSEMSDNTSDLPPVQKPDLTSYTGKLTLNSTILNEPKRSSRVRQPAKRDSQIMTWSEAVDTLASLDPDLHAGILDDVQAAGYDYQSWKLGRSSLPSSQHLDSLRNNPSRPATSHQMDRSESSNANPHKFPYRHLSPQELRPRPLGGEKIVHDFSVGAMAPCPHAECKESPEYMYKLQAPSGTEVSDMALHLLDAHNSMPFPCTEANCQRKGDRGYFIQEDLINHMKVAHPIGAQPRRRRAPVDVTPLNQNVEQFRQTITSTSQLVERAESQSKNSDLASHGVMGYIPGSSEAHSPSPEHNRTVTPSIYERGSRGGFASTPLTSVSSLKVNRSSVLKSTRQEVRDSQGRSSSPMITQRPVTVASSDRATDYRSPKMKSQPGEFVGDPFGGLELMTGDIGSPEIVATGETESMPRTQSVELGSLLNTGYLVNVSAQDAMHKSSPKSVASTITTVPNTEGSFSQLSVGSALASAKKRPGSKSIKQVETFTRNDIDASHEFSDDEGCADMIEWFAPSSSTSKLPPAEAPSYFVKAPITPLAKRETPQSAARTVLDQDEDLDELSLISDGYAILSSRTKPAANPAFGSDPRIKREESVDVRLLSVAKSRKRRLGEHQGSDEVDELGADECFGKSTGPHTRIKKESDVDGTPLTHRVKAKLKKATPSFKQIKSATGTSTPLLDLGLDRSRHASRESGGSQDSVSLINHSDANVDSKALEPAANSSPEENLLTPTSNRGQENRLANGKGPAIVVKTPGGTYRRCGDGTFRCGRNFCFRCGVQDIGVQAKTIT